MSIKEGHRFLLKNSMSKKTTKQSSKRDTIWGRKVKEKKAKSRLKLSLQKVMRNFCLVRCLKIVRFLV